MLQPAKKVDVSPPPPTGLVLAGGGARAAYQVGVLKAISELLPPRAPCPFRIISGTSAGAINGAALAIYAANFRGAMSRLVGVWENFHAEQVFRTDSMSVFLNGARWLLALAFGGLGKHHSMALFDRAPLFELLRHRLPVDKIQESIDKGVLRALSITASGYTSGQSVTFYQGAEGIKPWRRARRVGCPARIGLEHLMASSAIPFVFSAVKIHREYFGDGTMRQTAPLSAALHLGAERIFVVGAREYTEEDPARTRAVDYPSIAQIAGHVLNSIFLDSLEADLERLHRVNKTISLIPSHHLTEHGVSLRRIDTLVIAPSQEIDEIAMRHAHLLPWTVAFMLRGIGGLNRNGSNLLSYLLFEQDYCRELIALGHRDAMARKDEILRFLAPDAAAAHTA